MKSRIRKRRDYACRAQEGAESSGEDSSGFLYNLKSVSVIVEVLVGAVLGIALCFGFFFAFFVMRGSLIVSLGIFFIILIFAVLFVLALKYMLILVAMKMREIGLLEQILRRI